MTLPEPLQQIDRTCVLSGRTKLSYFAGCDYFRLSSHPAVLKAASHAITEFGLNVAASRMTTGNHALYGRLESRLAKFFKAESALLVSNGYVTNLVVAQALAGQFSHVLLDDKAHPSLKDAAAMFDCPVVPFKHRNLDDLVCAIRRCGPQSQIILLTDGMVAHDGWIAPLKTYLKLLPRNAFLLVDDAHGAGTLGKTGKGSIELEGVPRSRVIQTLTLSKAFGAYGGAVLCNRKLRNRIIAKSRLFVGSTPLPLPLAAAALESVNILDRGKALRARLNQNVAHVKKALKKSGYPVLDNPSPIVAVTPQNARSAKEIKQRCLKHGVFPSFINYPGGPENGFFRFVISSEHSRAQLEALIASVIGK